MNKSEFRQLLSNSIHHQPTDDQNEFFRVFTEFIYSDKDRCALILNGYAGTGKTTLISALVPNLNKIKWRYVLLAPTGRAAKVMSSYSKKPAWTIHKKIFRRATSRDGKSVFVRQNNLHKNTLFIVDESSMISSNSDSSSIFEGNSLLSDLIDYVYSGTNCRLLFVGDEAQLPPVGLNKSPALDLNYLQSEFYLKIARVQMTEVVRQDSESGILSNATLIRNRMSEIAKGEFSKLNIEGFEDIINLNDTDVQEIIEDAYSNFGRENTIIITRSNKRANYFNAHIRNQILWHDSEICSGDSMMIIKNNYYWMSKMEDVPVDFIANGDVVEIVSVRNYEERYGFKFVDATVHLKDYNDLPEMDVKIMLDAIWVDGPGLSSEQNSVLYYEVSKDYADLGSKKKIYDAISDDPYFNALRVKFSYAVTCHKAQGGQWPTVLIDQGFLHEDMLGLEYSRWLYTAITRASKQVYLLQFDEGFFSE